MNNLSDTELLELHTLCSIVVDGALSTTERERLETMLSGSNEARREYVRIISLSASLHDFASELQADAPAEPRALASPILRKWLVASSVLAAAAALVFGLWIHFSSGEAGAVTAFSSDVNEPIASISGLKDCIWNGAASQTGEELTKDRVLKIVSGLAEITFDSGARLVLEGPVTLAVRSAWEAELMRGSIKAEVPKEAIGFRLVHSAVNVVDLGTEFSMTADENGEAEVLVLKGAVEATSRQTEGNPSKRVLLNEKQGRRFAMSGMSEMHSKEQKLAKWSRKFQIERPSKPLAIARWSFDEIQNSVFPVQRSGKFANALDLEVVSAITTPFTGFMNKGRWENALQLDGHSFASSQLPHFSAKSPCTVAFWLKVPSDASPAEAAAALAWTSRDGSARTEFGWNASPGQGAYGALRMSTEHGHIIGSTPLRDGQWHHISVILSHAPRKPDHLQVTFYVDGRLESFSARHLSKRISSDVFIKAGTLLLGHSSSTSGGEGGFRGALDELVITDRALAPEEVRLLMRANKIGAQGAEMF